MNKRLLIIVLATLCLNFTGNVQAQTPENKAIDITTKGLQIGQQVPELPILSQYKGKLIILDFWATWCSPCVAMIPKLEKLQEQFNDQIQVIPVTYQKDEVVNTFLQKLQKGRSSLLVNINGDKELHKLFPHVYLPHYVWIDESGTVKAITGYSEVRADNIEKMIKSPAMGLKEKKDLRVAFDRNKPLFKSLDPWQYPNFQRQVSLTGYIDGIGSGYRFMTDSLGFKRATFRNQSLPMMYSTVFSGAEYFGQNRRIYEVKNPDLLINPDPHDQDKSWWYTNAWCLEIIMPGNTVNSHNILLEELNTRFSDYEVSVEKRVLLCDVLRLEGDAQKLTTKGGKPNASFDATGFAVSNQKIGDVVNHLNKIFLQSSDCPLVDGTGIGQPIDLSIQAPLSSIEKLNKAFTAKGLYIQREKRNINVLVFKDRKQNHE